MCGILGAYGKTQISVADELHLLTHRGPNHRGTVQINEVTLGHTRLAIVDVEHGQQPLQSPDGRYTLICNGEIYNHKDIRQALPDYPFQTESDSEVILALYQKHGPQAVSMLDGMFGFVLYDVQEDAILLARDPIGIKPLYYGWSEGTLYFGSEIKSLHHIVDELLEFPPGHYYTDGDLVQYFDLNDFLPSMTSYSTTPTIQDIRASLTQAVNKRLMSDVPLGVYLSGGLDSTIVAALVAQKKSDLHSFAVGVEGSEDLENARQAADMLGTIHHEYIYTAEEILEALPEIIYHLESFDPSLVRSAIPNYFLARMTRKYVTVVLTGEGADELYAGYHYLKKFDDQTLHGELIKLTASLYNCNLQRCDRMTMAHSIEARVPFLDTEFVALSMRIPKSEKIHPSTQTEKWVLRQAFSDILPEHVTWRRKEQFSQGAGSNHMLEAIAQKRFSDAEYMARASSILHKNGIRITSKEMLMYYSEFERFFHHKASHLVELWHGDSLHNH